MKLKIFLTFSLLVVLTMGILYAATPYEIVTDLTDLTADQCYELRTSGLTYGEIAEQYGVYDEFYDAMQTEREERLDALVEAGRITEEEADTMLENCDPSNPQYLMQGYGMGLGRSADANGNGFGGRGNGFGAANGGAGLGGGGYCGGLGSFNK
ncbi:hypothetical protein KHM83_02955 [Fusibacter paucivorans]|uniref:DUF2680 domain-containing protein n=1 Tax=Fusibacter paucivorans TaxID=76009 RepID=A0ABS5PKH5_9FIRM|nr:hypothetical protein [Fusibacter paucivorans]MBS7525629.1 hypothetical protein [Fusibacter paucivorans]